MTYHFDNRSWEDRFVQVGAKREVEVWLLRATEADLERLAAYVDASGNIDYQDALEMTRNRYGSTIVGLP